MATLATLLTTTLACTPARTDSRGEGEGEGEGDPPCGAGTFDVDPSASFDCVATFPFTPLAFGASDVVGVVPPSATTFASATLDSDAVFALGDGITPAGAHGGAFGRKVVGDSVLVVVRGMTVPSGVNFGTSGAHRLIFVVLGAAQLLGNIVAGAGPQSGGGCTAGAGNPSNTFGLGGGGGGGGHGANGGDGGMGTGFGGNGGGVGGTSQSALLLGGCPGARGGGSPQTPVGVAGGAGGGAFVVQATGAVTQSVGFVHADGVKGTQNDGQGGSGGGGGGAGGRVQIMAASIAVSDVTVRGGGGGDGAPLGGSGGVAPSGPGDNGAQLGGGGGGGAGAVGILVYCSDVAPTGNIAGAANVVVPCD